MFRQALNANRQVGLSKILKSGASLLGWRAARILAQSDLPLALTDEVG
jgi:hypothetical protein